MNTLYHIIRADFLERTRRYSFLIMLGLVLYLGYTVNAGLITLRLDTYRGIFNSAWVGSMMTLVINFFLGWFGFYLIKNSIARDYETGVGQIMATTPLSRPMYTLGKWLSNFAVLAVMVFILMLAAILMQLIQREDPQINLWALTAPFLFVALPFMGFIAAVAVLFETVSWLRGGFGNLVYFFLFITVISVITIIIGPKAPLLDWIGFGIFSNSMGEAARAVYPAYQNGFSLGAMPPVDIQTFYWSGVEWTLPIILTRFMTLLFGLGIALLGSLFFDRFDPSRERPRVKGDRIADSSEPVSMITESPVYAFQLTPITLGRSHFHFAALYLAELRMLFNGLRWWWYLVALGLIIASFTSPLEAVRRGLLPAVAIWPILVWSGLGCREMRHNTSQMVFSAPRPMLNQLPAAWLAGLTVSVLMVAGAAAKFIQVGEMMSLLSIFGGALFIPALALMLGVWTASSKTFEIVYVVWWYAGSLNKLLAMDYLGVHTNTYWLSYLLLSAVLILLAFMGRRRQLLIG
jgi:ABC-type transport system involved in multi-copper enzyme maturation permease subunit